jgi:hypothetical protein
MSHFVRYSIEASLRQIGIPEAEAQARARMCALMEMASDIRAARIRCLSTAELIGTLDLIWGEPDDRPLVIRRLLEVDLDPDDSNALAEALQRLDGIAGQLPRRFRDIADRVVSRLIVRLDLSVARRFAVADLDHARKARRLRAYQTLRRIGVGAELTPRIVQRFRDTGDQEALQLLARFTDSVAAADALFLLENLDEEYWRARVVQALLLAGSDVAIVQDRWPWELIYAAGRAGAFDLLPTIRAIVQDAPDDMHIRGIAIWTFGRLQARADIEDMARWHAETTSITPGT